MGWKNLKQEYDIEHIVCVTDKGICIGSPYIHNIIIIGFDGSIVKAYRDGENADLRRYMDEMLVDPKRLREAVQSPDVFEKSIPVYTYATGKVIEKQCEEPGWPNVTHDGNIMYDNMYSTDRKKVVKWAKENAEASLEILKNQIIEIKADLFRKKKRLKIVQANLKKLTVLDARQQAQEAAK